MTVQKKLLLLLVLAVTLPLRAGQNSHQTLTRNGARPGRQAGADIETNAGKWRTWVISSGKDYRVPPPPGPETEITRAELRSIAELVRQNNTQSLQQIEFWDALPRSTVGKILKTDVRATLTGSRSPAR